MRKISLIIICCTLISLGQLKLMCQTPMEYPIVVACDFEVLSKNAETGNIIKSALSSARHVLSCFYWKHLLSLPSTIAHMQQLGIELAKTTPGITNTIKALFTELEEKQYGKFTDTAIECFNDMGINPVIDKQALELLRTIKALNVPTIGMGNQDSLEHKIYARKLSEQQIDINSIYDGVITIPTFSEQTAFDLSQTDQDYFIHQKSNPRWLVSRTTYPSPTFTRALKILSHDLAGNDSPWAVSSIEQLAFVVRALTQVVEQRSPSPESMFDQIMEASPTLCPTKV